MDDHRLIAELQRRLTWADPEEVRAVFQALRLDWPGLRLEDVARQSGRCPDALFGLREAGCVLVACDAALRVTWAAAGCVNRPDLVGQAVSDAMDALALDEHNAHALEQAASGRPSLLSTREYQRECQPITSGGALLMFTPLL